MTRAFQRPLLVRQIRLQLLPLLRRRRQIHPRGLRRQRNLGHNRQLRFHFQRDRRQPLFQRSRFAFALIQPLRHAVHLRLLAEELAARPLGFQLQFAQRLARRRQLSLGLNRRFVKRRLRLLLLGDFLGQLQQFGARDVQVERSLRGAALQQTELAGERQPQRRHHLRPQLRIALSLGRLPLQRVHLARNLFQNVEHPVQILLRAFELRFGQTPLRLEARDPGRLFNHIAAIGRLRRKNLPNAALLNNGVRLRSQAGAHKDVLNVA